MNSYYLELIYSEPPELEFRCETLFSDLNEQFP